MIREINKREQRHSRNTRRVKKIESLSLKEDLDYDGVVRYARILPNDKLLRVYAYMQSNNKEYYEVYEDEILSRMK